MLFKKKKLDLMNSNIYLNHLKLEPVDFKNVFMDVMFYRDEYQGDRFKCEFKKFNDSFGHIKRFEKRYKKHQWYQSNISISNLLQVYMSPAGWLRRYACNYENCTGFAKDECIKCPNKYLDNFRLYQCLENFYENDFSDKIYSIKQRYDDNHCKENDVINLEFCFATLIQNEDNKFFVYDGNSRLLSYALYLKEYNYSLENKIPCYIGLRKDVIL